MDSVEKRTIYVTGNGEFLELGNISQKDYDDFMHMSPDAQKDYIRKELDKVPEEHRKHCGFCMEKQQHVPLKDCLVCSRNKGLTKKAEWEACKKTHLQRY